MSELSSRQDVGKGPGGAKQATLLYIEDTLSNLEAVKLIIDGLRPAWHLLAAHDGHSGLQQASVRRPDVILLNVQLPGMSADAVLTSLRATPAIAHIPVLVISGDDSVETHARLQALGASDYLLKPFNVNALVEKVDTLLDALAAT